MKRLCVWGCLLLSQSITFADELFSEGFEMVPEGTIYGTGGWYSDPLVVDREQEQYAVVKSDASSAFEGSNFLELCGGKFPSNTFYRIDGADAEFSQNNQFEFQIKRQENAGGGLVVKIFADKGSTEVVRLAIQPTGDVLVRGTSGELEKAGATVGQGEWTKITFEISVSDKTVAVGVKGMTDTDEKVFTVPFIRNESGDKLPFWAVAFLVDEAPGSRWSIDGLRLSDAAH